MPASDKIQRLVEVFERNLPAYKNSGYKEAQLRSEFIEPFFEELGWDVRNKQGWAEAYKDVITEDAIKVGGYTKAPDYCFRIGGTRKFFLEAKKPSVDIKGDVSPAYQLRRYAWSADLPLSILTDFEEFAVYNCRVRPQLKDKPGQDRVMIISYREYAERWDEIDAVFSRKAVLEGLFDKYAESVVGRRTTQEVDDEFLKEIEGWRDLLARNIALRNPSLSIRELNYAVQKTIDRIIFLRICEDRGAERYGQLQALLNGPRIYRRLTEIFQQADEKYNSGLFHFREEKGMVSPPDTLTTALTIDDQVLKEILKNLYYPDSPYEFSVLGSEILGNIYEQFLGKVIRLTAGHHAVVEEKPEVRKAGGVYYTPTYIVDYIVKNTVGNLCEGKTPKQIEKLKILDPACGSGSFLIGAYTYLLNYHRDWYVKHLLPERGFEGVIAKAALKKLVPGDKPEMPIYQGRGGQWYLSTREKKRILLNNIFGVDIDSQAVEVTKLSLLLKVLENENQDTLDCQMKFWRERALPDLGNNIKCGNSLIGPDIYEAGSLRAKRSNPISFTPEDRERINAFDWNAEFSGIMKSGGFDAVIGNPPYLAGREWPDSLTRFRTYFVNRYSCMTDQYDLYALFIQRAMSLLGTGGRFGLITPNTWLNNEHYIKLREWVITRAEVYLIGDYRDIRVFPSATVLPVVVVATRCNKPKPTASCLIEAFSTPLNSQRFETSVAIWKIFPGIIFNLSISKNELPILKKIERHGRQLSELADVRFGVKVYQRGKGRPPQSGEEAENRIFEADRKKTPRYVPYLWGEHLTRWHIIFGNTWLKYGPHLAEPRTFDLFQDSRVLVRRIVGERLIVCPTQETLIADQLLHTVKLRPCTMDYRILAGILGSSCMAYYFKKRYNRTEKTFPEIRIAELAALPIAICSKADEGKMVALVERMLDLHKKLAVARNPDEKTRLEREIKAADAQIDRLVYELYGLTEEEIAIVEGIKS